MSYENLYTYCKYLVYTSDISNECQCLILLVQKYLPSIPPCELYQCLFLLSCRVFFILFVYYWQQLMPLCVLLPGGLIAPQNRRVQVTSVKRNKKPVCVDGSRWRVGCNWCTCHAGMATCTLKACLGELGMKRI